MKKPQGVPEWFSLDKYQEMHTLSPMDWYQNLLKRRIFFTCTHPSLKTWPVADLKKDIEIIIKMITENPIIRAPQDKKTSHSRNTVESLSNGALVKKFLELNRNAPEEFFEYLDLEKQSSKNATTMRYRNEILIKFFNSPFRSWRADHGFLSVNLYATDDHIIQDFKDWLSDTRKTQAKASTKRAFSSLDFAEWCDFKILPYLDLKIWGVYTGLKITQAMIGNAIFPDELNVDTTERIRKTTKKKAEWLMNHSVLHALGVQLQKERGSSN